MGDTAPAVPRIPARAAGTGRRLRGMPRPGRSRVHPLLPVRAARGARSRPARRRRGAHLLCGEGHGVRRRPVALQGRRGFGDRSRCRADVPAGPAARLPARPRRVRVAAGRHDRARLPGRGADRLRPARAASPARAGRPVPAAPAGQAGHQAGASGPLPRPEPLLYRTGPAASQRPPPRGFLGFRLQRPVRGGRAETRGGGTGRGDRARPSPRPGRQVRRPAGRAPGRASLRSGQMCRARRSVARCWSRRLKLDG